MEEKKRKNEKEIKEVWKGEKVMPQAKDKVEEEMDKGKRNMEEKRADGDCKS